MTSSFTLFKVRGIEVGANWTWLVVFGLVAWSLSQGLFPSTYPGLGDGTYLVMGVVTALIFFGSIVLHELGHAFRALKEGMRIEGITLWLFGGVARFAGLFPSAGAEFRIAIAGPVVSVVLAAIFWAASLAPWPEPVRGVLDYLARINAIVVAFNLVPALPLDGGRVLRAWLWHRQRSFTAATASAARAGLAFGALLIGVGLLGLFTGASGGGLWLVLLGWFLRQAARSEEQFAVLKRAFRGVSVADLMTPDPDSADPDETIDEFLGSLGRTRAHATYPVLDGGRLAGMITLRAAGAVDPDDRRRTRVGDVMLRDVPTVSRDAEVEHLLEVLRDGPGRAIVVDGGSRVEGIVSSADVAKVLEIEQARGPEPEAGVRGPGALVWVVVVAIMTLAVAALYHPPLAVVTPGEALDVSRDITIEGVPTTPPTGRILLTSVRIQQPSALMAAIALIRSREIVPIDRIIPGGVDPDGYLDRQRDLFRESRTTAAAAAARAAGLDVTVAGTGARVLDVARGTPASRILRTGDVIASVDGKEISVASDLSDAIASRPVGTTFGVTFERDGERQTTQITSAAIGPGPARIGVVVETRDLDVRLPFTIDFDERPEIGGPSAGLAYALAIADLLDPRDLARGRTIAATGTISLEGAVGEVGGVAAKAEGATQARAGLFIVPAGEVDEARGIEGLHARGVRDLGEAIAALAT